MSAVANDYAEVLWRQSLNAQTPGLSNALYFYRTSTLLDYRLTL